MIRLFVAGATGFLGRALAMQDATKHGVELVLQARPGASGRHHLGDDPRVREVDLADPEALAEALSGCHAALQLIGSRRARFDEVGDYEAVDYGTTLQLVEGAKRAGGVRHLLHVSSVGAGRPIGTYLAWKRRAEQAVLASGIDATIVRPSWIGGDDELPERRSFAVAGAFLRGFSETPLSGWVAKFRPMSAQLLARVLLVIAREHAPLGVVDARGLYRLAKEHDLYPWVR